MPPCEPSHKLARLDLRIEPELLAELDAVLGNRPRSDWIRDAIRRAIAAEKVAKMRAELNQRLEAMRKAQTPFFL